MDFVAERHCGAWAEHPGLVALNVTSDLLTALSYFVIAAIVVGWLRRRHDSSVRHVFWLFGAFIATCGATHVMSAVVFFVPAFRGEAIVKAACALISVLTAFLLVPLTPKVMRIPTVSTLFEANMRLRSEVAALQRQAASLEGPARIRAEAAIREVEDTVRRAREQGGSAP